MQATGLTQEEVENVEKCTSVYTFQPEFRDKREISHTRSFYRTSVYGIYKGFYRVMNGLRYSGSRVGDYRRGEFKNILLRHH